MGIYAGGTWVKNVVGNIFKKYDDDIEIINKTISECSRTKEYRGPCMQCLSGDSFCQTWSLLFIFKYFQTENFDFLIFWKSMSQESRNRLLIMFVLGILDNFLYTIDSEANFELQNTYNCPQYFTSELIKEEYNIREEKVLL